MPSSQEKLQDLIKAKWHDKYLCRLALLDHLRECLEKDNRLKATDAPKNGDGFRALDKELMDLKIIMEMYFADAENLYQERLDKFLENLRK